MEILDKSKQFDYERLENELKALSVPTDFKIRLKPEVKSYWGRYFPLDKEIVSYVYGLDYDTSFPHILHECIHHFQHTHQKGFKRKHGVMHDNVFEDMYESKLREWECIIRR